MITPPARARNGMLPALSARVQLAPCRGSDRRRRESGVAVRGAQVIRCRQRHSPCGPPPQNLSVGACALRVCNTATSVSANTLMERPLAFAVAIRRCAARESHNRSIRWQASPNARGSNRPGVELRQTRGFRSVPPVARFAMFVPSSYAGRYEAEAARIARRLRIPAAPRRRMARTRTGRECRSSAGTLRAVPGGGSDGS